MLCVIGRLMCCVACFHVLLCDVVYGGLRCMLLHMCRRVLLHFIVVCCVVCCVGGVCRALLFIVFLLCFCCVGVCYALLCTVVVRWVSVYCSVFLFCS